MFLFSLPTVRAALPPRTQTHALACDSLAAWSKALASGASPQGRGFEPHSCHFFFNGEYQLANHILERRSTTDARPQHRAIERFPGV